MSSSEAGCFFEPDPEGARALDSRMRARLGQSLRYVIDQVSGQLDVPTGLDGFLARLAAGPVSPQAFGAYYDLVLALEDGAIPRAEGLLREIAEAPGRPPALVVKVFEPPEPGSPWDRYRRQADTDPTAPIEMIPPDADAARAAQERIVAALALLDRGHPQLAAEIRALLAEIVLAGSRDLPTGMGFAGVASFMLWGGVVLNVKSHLTRIDMLKALVHEAAHDLLFGFSVDGPLVANPDEELYDSPLRRDRRPLDGVYHATFVTARMHHAQQRLLEAGVLEADEAGSARASLEDLAKRFAEGIDVIDRHGRLTPMGLDAMAGARDWMQRSARV